MYTNSSVTLTVFYPVNIIMNGAVLYILILQLYAIYLILQIRFQTPDDENQEVLYTGYTSISSE